MPPVLDRSYAGSCIWISESIETLLGRAPVKTLWAS